MATTAPNVAPAMPEKLSRRDRRSLLIQREWTKAERNIVLQGVIGRALIAIEPVLCGSVFLALTIALFLRHQYVIAPIFGLAVLAFAAYAIIVMVKPVKAILETHAPIYIVDGYIRYRAPDAASEEDANGYVAVLLEDRRVACEWPTEGDDPVPDTIRPALLEFTDYGGIHRIDGRSTGVLPDKVPKLGIGV